MVGDDDSVFLFIHGLVFKDDGEAVVVVGVGLDSVVVSDF